MQPGDTVTVRGTGRRARIVEAPRPGLPPLLFAAGKARRDLEAASSQTRTADGDRDGVGLSRRERRGNTVECDRAAGRVDGVVEVAEVAGLFTESAGHVGIRSFLERRHRQGRGDQNDRERG